MLRVDYAPNGNLSACIRYHYRQKEKNMAEDEKEYNVLPYRQQRLRVQASCRLSPSVLSRTSADGIIYSEETGNTDKGIMIAQSIGWQSAKAPLQADLYLAWFHTDDYNTRISSYERNLLYSFYMPSFYGRGIRLAATFRWEIIRRLSLSLKIGHTRYSDREVIGTGTEEIAGNSKTDFSGKLRWRF
jgi:hypothetical protein